MFDDDDLLFLNDQFVDFEADSLRLHSLVVFI